MSLARSLATAHGTEAGGRCLQGMDHYCDSTSLPEHSYQLFASPVPWRASCPYATIYVPASTVNRPIAEKDKPLLPGARHQLSQNIFLPHQSQMEHGFPELASPRGWHWEDFVELHAYAIQRRGFDVVSS